MYSSWNVIFIGVRCLCQTFFCLVLDLRPLCYESLRISFIDNDEFVIFETAVFLVAQEAEGTVGTEVV